MLHEVDVPKLFTLFFNYYLLYFSIIISGKVWSALYLVEKSQKEHYLMVH